MINLILQIIVFSSLGLIIYMIARAIPRVPEEVAPSRRSNWVDRMMSKIPMAKIDENINSTFMKFLRKAKVIVMKADNFITDHLGKLTKKSGANTPPAPNQDEHKTIL